MYEDFYDNYSEFDRQIEEFKQSLIDGVKSTYVEEMEKLRKENAKLQETKRNLEKFESEHKTKIRELEIEKQSVGRMYFKDLVEKHLQEFYYAYNTHRRKKKCPKCNERRYIEYTSPSGKKATEPCDVCYDSVYVAIVKPTKCARITHGGKDAIFYYEFESSYDKEYDISCIDFIVTNENEFNFKKPPYGKKVLFETAELCQKYCDIKNAKINFDELINEKR